jgi:hypothetical protein
MFRLQDNVPEVYVQKSRDFQLFCRAYDSLFNGTKYLIDSVTHTSNTMECNNTLLRLLANKLGLFTNLNLPDIELRYVLCAFPILIRYKGSLTSIEYTIRVFQRLSKLTNLSYDIDIDNTTKQISLIFSVDVANDALLYDLLSYIIPTGYTCSYVAFTNGENVTRIVTSSEVSIEIFDPVETSKVYYHKDSGGEQLPLYERYKVGTAVVNPFENANKENTNE